MGIPLDEDAKWRRKIVSLGDTGYDSLYYFVHYFYSNDTIQLLQLVQRDCQIKQYLNN